MGLAEVLTIVFVILKLTGLVHWSWWLVLLPEEIALSFYALYLLFFLGVISIGAGLVFGGRKNRRTTFNRRSGL
jgi:uncharacterized membrane protein